VAKACLALDFDGTILDTEESLYRAWAELWATHGHQLQLDQWQRNIGTDEVFDPWEVLERRIGRAIDPMLRDSRRARRDEIQSRFGPRPGVLEWLSEADRLRLPVGIASSSPLEWVDSHLTRLGLRSRFSCVVCRDDDTPAKPAPHSYLAVCRQLDADPLLSVAVEDSPHGVAAAIAAGLFTVAVPHPLTANLDLSDAHLIATSLSELSLPEALVRAADRPRGVRP
jgi:HAD superfamily hydrolase (TIGR01509 family)